MRTARTDLERGSLDEFRRGFDGRKLVMIAVMMGVEFLHINGVVEFGEYPDAVAGIDVTARHTLHPA